MTNTTHGNRQIIEADRLLSSLALGSNDEIIAHTQAVLTLALVREQRTANLIAWLSRPGWQPSRESELLITAALGLEEGDA